VQQQQDTFSWCSK